MIKTRILLVEDDQSLGYVLSEYLDMNGFEVLWKKDGQMGWESYQQEDFDICVLDIMMPRKDGMTLAAEIKAHNPQQPIIFLSAKSLKVDKLKGFKLGCDDYIVKPVDEEELIARIEAVVRRTTKSARRPDGNYQIGDYTFDAGNQQLIYGDELLALTEKEAEILRLLCEKKGQILQRKETLRQLWGQSDYFNRRSMDVFVSKLRKILSRDPRIRIKNIHGKGFILQD